MTRVTITRQLDVRDASSIPVWRQGMAQWEWKEFTGSSSMSGTQPTTVPPGNLGGRIDAWNSLCANGASVYTAAAGGHTDYSGNEAYQLDLSAASPAWAILRQPTPAAYISYDVDRYAQEPDGKQRPAATQHYFTLFYVNDQIVLTGLEATYGTGTHRSIECVAYDLATNDWLPKDAYPDVPSQTYAHARCIDPRDETIYYVGSTRLYKRSAAGAWTALALFSPVVQSEDAFYKRSCAVDTTRNRIVFFQDAYRVGSNGGVIYDIASDSYSQITLTGTYGSHVASLYGPGVWFDATLDRFILKDPLDDTVYTVHPTTFAVEALATTGGAGMADAAAEIYNRFIYVPDLAGFFYQPRHSSNGWFLASE